MIILGVDPGSRATGYGVIDTAPVARFLGGGVVRPRPGAPLSERLRDIHAGIAGAIAEFGPDALVVERVFNARNPHSALVLGHARGVALLAGAQAGLVPVEYSAREIKLAVTGNGSAAKEQVRFMVMRLLGLSSEPPLDMSDALAAALAHHGRARLVARG
ncbi:crossover junction endodeoxyribonuclease RuvC [bacterium]|nr:crossover junction endodeoxyribonuclease RuvC [bacterium]